MVNRGDRRLRTPCKNCLPCIWLQQVIRASSGLISKLILCEYLRTALITHSFNAGIETFIWRHIRALAADVVVEDMDEFALKGMNSRPYVGSLCHRKQCEENLARHIARRLKEVCLGIPAPKWPKGMEAVWEQYVHERKPDVALAEFGPNGIKAMKACRRTGVPLVVHFHGYDASSLLRIKSYRKQLPTLFANAAAVVVVSRQMQQTLEQFGCPASKLHLIPCGAPIDEFPLGDEVESQPCKFLAVSSFTPVKGVLYTLRAFAQCAGQCPGVTLTMIGAGKEFQKSRSWVKRAGLSNNVHFLGDQPIGVVQEYMANSAVFVQHSIITRIGHVEGWGVSMAEAASSGMPVVATNHGGIPDHVIDGVTGFLVEERDWEAMAEQMVLLAKSPALRRKMGLAGRRNIEKVGNFELQIEKLRAVLTRAANRRVEK